MEHYALMGGKDLSDSIHIESTLLYGDICDVSLLIIDVASF